MPLQSNSGRARTGRRQNDEPGATWQMRGDPARPTELRGGELSPREMWRSWFRRRMWARRNRRKTDVGERGAIDRRSPPLITGALCGATAAACWGAGFVAARHGVLAGLDPVDIGFHRFVWAGLFLLPAVWRAGFRDLGGMGWGRGMVALLLA